MILEKNIVYFLFILIQITNYLLYPGIIDLILFMSINLLLFNSLFY